MKIPNRTKLATYLGYSTAKEMLEKEYAKFTNLHDFADYLGFTKNTIMTWMDIEKVERNRNRTWNWPDSIKKKIINMDCKELTQFQLAERLGCHWKYVGRVLHEQKKPHRHFKQSLKYTLEAI